MAVDDLSFEVAAGEVLGFLGPNGAGKITAMRIATGFLPPSRGPVVIDGCNLMQRPIDASATSPRTLRSIPSSRFVSI